MRNGSIGTITFVSVEFISDYKLWAAVEITGSEITCQTEYEADEEHNSLSIVTKHEMLR